MQSFKIQTDQVSLSLANFFASRCTELLGISGDVLPLPNRVFEDRKIKYHCLKTYIPVSMRASVWNTICSGGK
jgi:hypothetical protein